MFIQCPAALDDVKVALIGTGPAGTICISGGLSSLQLPTTIVTIKVKVYQGHVITIPANAPADAVAATISGTEWCATGISAPDSSPTAQTAKLTAAAWQLAGGVVEVISFQWFYGRQGAGTDCCEDCGSVSGTTTATAAASSQGVAVGLAPARWVVPVAGFGNPALRPLNGNWVLSLRDPTGITSIWDNDGDGVTVPRIELTCGSPPTARWRLRLRHNGTTIEYTAPATWDSVSSLTLSTLSPDRSPTILTAVPA